MRKETRHVKYGGFYFAMKKPKNRCFLERWNVVSKRVGRVEPSGTQQQLTVVVKM